MRKIPNILAIALSMAFLFSCGKVEEEDKSDAYQSKQYLSVGEIPELEEDEANLVKSACSLLSRKERLMKSSYVGKSLKFSTQKRACGAGQSTKYVPVVIVKESAGVLYFENRTSNAFMFNDIILKNSSDMKNFCDLVDSNGLTKRYITSGSELQYIYAESASGTINIGIRTGYDSNNSGQFEMEVTDEFEIVNNGSKDNGFLSRRIQRNWMNCSGSNVEVYYAERQF